MSDMRTALTGTVFTAVALQSGPYMRFPPTKPALQIGPLKPKPPLKPSLPLKLRSQFKTQGAILPAPVPA
jgi:hypothetical protein